MVATRTVTADIQGGDKLQKYLHTLALRLGHGGSISVGFLENATYPAKTQKDIENKILPIGANKQARQNKAKNAKHSDNYGGGVLHVAQVAFWDNYGTTRMPARPFFTEMIEDQAPTWARKLGAAAKYSQYRWRQTLEIVAADIKGHLIESIDNFEDPPLSDYTIKKKGFSKPLIDTAVMVRSVDWVVEAGTPVKATS